MSNILVIKHGSLGDISQISGVLKDIKETYNDKKIFILTTLPYVELLSKCPYINGVLIDKRLPRWNILYLIKLKKMLSKFDFSYVYDLQNSPRTSFYRRFLLNITNWSSTETILKKGEKKRDFDNARKDFYNSLSTISIDEPVVEPWKIKSKIAECYFNNNDYSNAIKNYRKNYYDTSWEENWKYADLSMLALSEFRAGQIDSAKIHFNLVEKKYSTIDHDDDFIYYYTDWPLYQYYDANGNAKKALKYLDYAHDNIPDDEQREYLEDRKRMDHLYKYYYVHEINEAYNRQIR